MLKRLADKHPSSVAQLTLQYRMHGAICQLCNDIVYGGKLRCANEEVETSLLRLPGFPSAILKHAGVDPTACWMTDVIDPSQPVVFVDTDSIRSHTASSQSAIRSPSLEGAHSLSTTAGLERTTGKKGKGNVVNDTEAVLIRQVIHGLLECGMEISQIGVICPFRSQVRRSSTLQEMLCPWRDLINLSILSL
jgi:DNA replication ATP-dependent helicase Dna2